jgi:protein O-GlcNAc transferase
MSSSERTFQEALNAFNSKKFPDAERHFRKLLKSHPSHVGALNLLTVALMSQERYQDAEPFIARAVKLQQSSDVSYYNYGLISKKLNKPVQALEQFNHALRLNAGVAETWNNRGTVFNDLKQFDNAVSDFDRALALNPGYAEAFCNKGKSLIGLKRSDDALAAYDRAVTLAPDVAEGWVGRGNVLCELERYSEALLAFEKALALKPDFAEGWIGHGSAMLDLGRVDEAVSSYQKGLTIKPGAAEGWLGLGYALRELKQFKEAYDAFDKALTLKPDLTAAWLSRGGILFETNKNDQAIADFEKVLEINKPNFLASVAACLSELQIIYENENDIESRRAAYQNKLTALRDQIESGDDCGDPKDLFRMWAPFYLAYQGRNDRDLQRVYGSMACRIMEREFPAATPSGLAKSGEKIRIGIVSAYFFRHSNWKIPIHGWLSQLDRSRFQVFGYHVGKEFDSATEQAAVMCDRFTKGVMPIEDWRKQILADAPHVLIYPGLMMEKVTLQLAAMRLAPVQCNSWGHPDTSGMPSIDYFLSSDLMEPVDGQDCYTEELVRLPNLSIYYEPAAITPSPIGRAELGLRDDAVAFWCGQSQYKYLPQHDDVFARISESVGNCQFVFIRHGVAEVTDTFRGRLERAFALRGRKASDYCVYLPFLDSGAFIAAVGCCDIFLDSIGWSGCNSTLESLVQNLPIVAMDGSTMRGRHSAAILRMMGVPETIAKDVDEFVSLAARLATHADERQAMSRKIALHKDRVYRDRTCIAALESFLERVGREA